MNVKAFVKSVIRPFGARTRWCFSLRENELEVREHFSEFILTIPVYEDGTNHWSNLEEYLLDAPELTSRGQAYAEELSLDAPRLRKALAYCILAIDRESTRYALGGVLWDGCKLVSTDGRRMHVQDVELASEYDREGMEKPVIPSNAVSAFLVASRALDHVAVEFDRDNVTFTCNQWTIRARLLEGRFPNWRAVMPENLQERDELTFVKELRLHCKELVERAKLKNKQLRRTLTRAELRAAVAEAPEFIVDGVKFNAQYVLDAVSNIDEKAFKIELGKDKHSPAMIGNAVVMPMA